MTDNSEEYRRGLVEGRMSAMEEQQRRIEGRVNNHDHRISSQERITFAMLGAFALIQVWPTIERALSG